MQYGAFPAAAPSTICTRHGCGVSISQGVVISNVSALAAAAQRGWWAAALAAFAGGFVGVWVGMGVWGVGVGVGGI